MGSCGQVEEKYRTTLCIYVDIDDVENQYTTQKWNPFPRTTNPRLRHSFINKTFQRFELKIFNLVPLNTVSL